MKKRITALFLLVCMLLTLLPVGALADEEEGTPVPAVEPAPPQNEGGGEDGSGTGGSTGGNGSSGSTSSGSSGSTSTGTGEPGSAGTGSGGSEGSTGTDGSTGSEGGSTGGSGSTGTGETHTHTFTNWKDDQDGKNHTGTCECGQTKTEPHQWGSYTDKGETHERTCSVCHATETTAHDYVYTSDGNGKHTGKCKTCGKTLEPEACKKAAAPRHVGDADNKEHEYYCELCDASLKKEKCAKTLTKATCIEPPTCTKCGESYDSVDPEAHNYCKWQPDGDGKTHSKVCVYCNAIDPKYENKPCTKASKPRHIDGTETHEDYCTVCKGSMGSAEDCTKKYQPTKNGTHKVLCTECGATLKENVPCTSDPSTDRCGQKAYCQYCYQDFGDKLGHDFGNGGGCARFPEGRCSCTKASHRKLWNTTNASQSTVYCDKCHTDVEKEKIRADFTVSNYKLGKPVSGLKVSTGSAHVKVKGYTVSPDSGKFDANQVYSVTVEFTTDPGYEVTYATIGGSAATLTDSHNAAVANLPKFGTEFTVTYNNMGHGKPKKTSEKVTYPGTVKPETLSETGYVFGGWYMDEGCTKAFKASVPVASNMTLYAKWSVARTLKFDAKSGKMSPSSKNFADGEVVNLKDYTPTRSGYWFCGWFKDSKLTGRKLETIKMDANKTVYAKWKKEDTTNPKTGDTIGLAVGVLALTTVLGAAVVTKKKRTR